MKGFPKVFSTKQDFYNVRDDYPEQVKNKLKQVMEGRFIWVSNGELPEGSLGINDDTHMTIETKPENAPMDSTETVLVQLVMKEDEHSEFKRLGWTEQEAIEFLAYEPVEVVTR